MSYSIYPPVRGATKDEVMQRLRAAFEATVLPPQPMHAHDMLTHLAHVDTQLDLVPVPCESEDYLVTMNGSLSWTGDTARRFTGASFGCSVQIVPKE